MAQTNYVNDVSTERILAKQQHANGRTRQSSLYKNITTIVFIATMVVCSVIILCGSINITQQKRTINTLNAEILSLEAERDNYNMQLEPYKTVDRISKLAKFKYGMDFPKKDKVKYLDKLK